MMQVEDIKKPLYILQFKRDIDAVRSHKNYKIKHERRVNVP